MRMLFVIEDLASGGAQRQMINLAKEMQNRGHKVEFFYYQPFDFFAPQLKAANIPMHFHPKGSRYSLRVFFMLRNVIQKGKFDVVLSFLSVTNFYTVVVTRMMRNRPKIVISERLSDESDRLHWRMKLVRSVYPMAEYVTANSQHQRLQLIRQQPVLEKKIATIYNGYDLVKFHPPEKEPSNDVLKLIVIGRVVPNKNAICLIKALSILNEQYNLRAEVSWVGEHFDQHSDELNREIAARNLQDQWHWLHQREDIVDLLHQHDALVHPSYNEGLPNVVCEALACGRPVIVSNLQDHPYLVQQGVSGYLFEWDDPNDLAKAIADFHRLSPEERRKMGQNGRQFAEQNLSQARLTDQYEDLFKRLLSRS